MSRQDQSRVTVYIQYPGASVMTSLGVWENRTGGNGDSESTKHREGGMGDEQSYGGPQTTENTSVERRYDIVRDHSVIKKLLNARGRGWLVIVEQPLDEFKVAFGEPISYGGKLKAVNQGEVNANSGDIRMITLEQDTVSIT